MSEYQYYEFRAIDRPLTAREMSELRRYSSRATISPTRFVNFYNWGGFKGNPSAWMEKYFDAFLHLTNWGTRELMLRLPRRMRDLKTAKLYCAGEGVTARVKGDFVFLDFCSEDESNDDDGDDGGEGRLSSLLPLRADVASGELRALYLGWLWCAQTGVMKNDAAEPPVPAGLGALTAPLQAFADFLRIDADLIAAGAARSPEGGVAPSGQELERWIAALPAAEKTDLLARLAGGSEPHLRADLLRRFRQSRTTTPRSGGEAPRTVSELLKAAEQHATERRRKEAERAERERARREREAAQARERYLAGLAEREAEAWRQVEALIAAKQPGKYDEAVKLLGDLRDLGLRPRRAGAVEARLRQLREEHARKPSFIERLKKAGLAAVKT